MNIFCRAILKKSSAPSGECFVCYQVRLGRRVRTIETTYQLHPSEWDAQLGTVVRPAGDGERSKQLVAIAKHIWGDRLRFDRAACECAMSWSSFTLDDVVRTYEELRAKCLFSRLMEERISRNEARGGGGLRTAEADRSALNSFMRFTGGEDIPVDEFDSDLMRDYEAYLKSQGLKPGTLVFYLKRNRAVYNEAVKKGLVEQTHPFRDVSMRQVPTPKLAFEHEEIKKVAEADLSEAPDLDFARWMFILSLLLQGMSFVDMAYLTDKNLSLGRLVYQRRKCGSQVSIKWLKCMQRIIDKYRGHGGPYLLPIIMQKGDERFEQQQLRSMQRRVNRALKKLSGMLHLSHELSMNGARHTWATWTRDDASLAVASLGLGHSTERMTLTYLGNPNYDKVDKQNRKNMEYIFGKNSILPVKSGISSKR